MRWEGKGNKRTWPSQEMSQRCVVVCFPLVDWDTEEISLERRKGKDEKRQREREGNREVRLEIENFLEYKDFLVLSQFFF